jgi:hypothetical protein
MKTPLKNYYVRFDPKAKIDYLVLFSLYDIAEYNPKTKVFDTIHYSSVAQLAEKTGLSNYAITKMMKDKTYSDFLIADKGKKEIFLKNNFSNCQKQAFVKLTYQEVALLRTVKETPNLFCRYWLYLKYYCGYSKSKKTDFTAK